MPTPAWRKFTLRSRLFRAGEEGVVPATPGFIPQPVVILIRHKGDGLYLRLGDGQEKPVALLRDFERAERDDEAVLARSKEPARGHNHIVLAIPRPEDDIANLAHDLIVGAADLATDDLICSKTGDEIVG